jgi:hypothetical protein
VHRDAQAAAGAIPDAADDTLVVFPEHLGFLLSVVPYHLEIAQRSGSFASFIAELAGSDSREARYELFVRHSTEVAGAYDALFSAVARELGAYIVAGSLTVPPMDESPHTDGRRVLDDRVLHNESPLFAPNGLCIGRTAKVRIPPGEDRFADPGDLAALGPARTRIGSIGTALCFDGYHHRTLEQLDARGTSIVAQPIHFAHPGIRYDGTGSIVPAHEDLGRLLQGRENIRFGVCAALVGEVFPDRRAEGISHIVANRGEPGVDPDDPVLATVTDPFAPAIVSALVDL